MTVYRVINDITHATGRTADKKGALVAGMDADIVIFDKNINVETTIIKGKIVFNKTFVNNEPANS